MNFDDSEQRLLHGDYTENVLRDAGIHEADVFVAGADVDAVNLGATTLARRVNADIFVVIRQNQMQDRALIEAAHADLKFVQSEIMVQECLQVLKTPMLGRFLAHLRGRTRQWPSACWRGCVREVGPGSPRAWGFDCDVLQPACSGRSSSAAANLSTSRTSKPIPRTRRSALRVAALMLERGEHVDLMPAPDTALRPGDRILFVGDEAAFRLQRRYLVEPGTIAWVCSGKEPPQGMLFRWWQQRSRAA